MELAAGQLQPGFGDAGDWAGRLDLPADHVKAAREAGVKFSIDTDAHSVGDLSNVPYGVGTAQRGWLTPDDVINTWPLEKLLEFFRKG